MLKATKMMAFKIVLKLMSRLLSSAIGCVNRLENRTGIQVLTNYPKSRYGVRLKANWNDRTFQYCMVGTYGTGFSDLLRKQEHPFVFLDIGANQGLYSLIAATNPKCRKVIALEPVKETFDLLNYNIIHNNATSIITPVCAGLSDTAGTATISVYPGHSGRASLKHQSNPEFQRKIKLHDMQSLDDLIPDAWPIIVKVDVEGYEDVVIPVLLRSRHTARMNRIFYEVDKRWTDPVSIESLLDQAGFKSLTHYGAGRHFDVLAERLIDAVQDSATIQPVRAQ